MAMLLTSPRRVRPDDPPEEVAIHKLGDGSPTVAPVEIYVTFVIQERRPMIAASCYSSCLWSGIARPLFPATLQPPLESGGVLRCSIGASPSTGRPGHTTCGPALFRPTASAPWTRRRHSRPGICQEPVPQPSPD